MRLLFSMTAIPKPNKLVVCALQQQPIQTGALSPTQNRRHKCNIPPETTTKRVIVLWLLTNRHHHSGDTKIDTPTAHSAKCVVYVSSRSLCGVAISKLAPTNYHAMGPNDDTRCHLSRHASPTSRDSRRSLGDMPAVRYPINMRTRNRIQ